MTCREWKRLARKLARYRAHSTSLSRRFFRRHPEFLGTRVMPNQFEDFLVEKGARALAKRHGHDPDAAKLIHDGMDMRKRATQGDPWWHYYREDAQAVIAEIFERPVR